MKKAFFALSGFFLLFAVMFYFRRDRSHSIGNASTGGANTNPPAAGAPAVAGIVFHDPMYDTIAIRPFQVLKSDVANGEYQFELDARVLEQALPITPTAGDTWEFSFADTKVCALGVACTDALGQGRRPSTVTGSDRLKYNADDFPVQSVAQQAAAAYTASAILDVSTSTTWVVPPSSAGKPVSIGFNIRQSESSTAKGGGVLTIRTKR